MTDFLDRYGEQLVAAERSLSRARTVPRGHRRRTRRAAMLALAAMAIVVPALAATQPWRPILGRPRLHSVPRGISLTGAPRDQLAGFAVLRRPQSVQDRGPIARALLRSLGPEQGGVRLSSARLLTGANGRHALLISTASAGLPDGPAADKVTNELCLLLVGGGLCAGDSPVLFAHGLLGSGPGVFGLVPDGVASVVLRFQDGRSYRTAVRQNFFWVTDTPTEERKTGNVAPLRLPEPLKSIQWLDRAGHAIKTSR